MTEKFLPHDQQQKSEHRESSPLRSQPEKNCKTFIPQSKILKKILSRLFLINLNSHIFVITC